MISEHGLERYASFAECVERRDKGRWLVLTHDNPDPDALASAAILAKVLRRAFHKNATVAYGGMIGRAENQEMVRVLRLQHSRIRHLNWKNYPHIALVDAQPHTGNNQLPAERIADVVIDHHPLRKATQITPFRDIRVDYGATATILSEYLLASGLQPSKRDATAIVYAIRSETLDFGRESPGPDRVIYDHFFPLADKTALGKIQRPRLPLSYFQTLKFGLDNLEHVDSLVVCRLGRVAQPDIVPEIADLLLRMAGKTWSLCSGFFEDRIYCSMRTTNPRADASRLMRRLLGRKGKGGGHGMIAGGWLELSAGQDPETAQRNLGRRLAKLLRKNPDRLMPLVLGEEGEARVVEDEEGNEVLRE